MLTEWVFQAPASLVDSLQEYIDKLERNGHEYPYNRQPGNESNSTNDEETTLPANFKQERGLLLLDFDLALEETQPSGQSFAPFQDMSIMNSLEG